MPTDTSTIDVNYVAHLARLSLSPEEQAKFAAQLKNILHYVDKLKELDVANIEPTAHAVPITNVVRKDVVKPSLPTELALKNAPQKANNLFIVPKIVE
jgi:aspartyl-tRNA(Asn)/glutamyl-tRNA(Gln) amidotransferase subunit C